MTTLTAKPRPPRAGERGSVRTTRVPKALVALIALLGVVCVAPTPALAVFTRPYISQITGAPTGPLGEEVPFHGVGGIAAAGEEVPLDPGEAGNIWVGSLAENETQLVDQFNSANVFVAPQLTGYSIGSLAFDDTSGALESAPGTQGQADEWVAVDNSRALEDAEFAGDVYFESASHSVPSLGVVRRETATHALAPFTCPQGTSEKYIDNGELVGVPGQKWENKFAAAVGGIAVDSSSGGSAGDVYVVGGGGNEVDRFSREGCFLGVVTEAAVPEQGAFADGGVNGIAVDPTDGDLLVEAEAINNNQKSVFIDEFTASGEYLGRVSGTSKDALFTRFGRYNPYGIAVSSAGDLYLGVDERAEGSEPARAVVDKFGPSGVYPVAVTGGVTDDLGASAVLDGEVGGVKNSKGELIELTGCEFEYVSEEAYLKEGGFAAVKPDDRVPCVLESGGSPVGQRLEEKNYAVHAAATGLVPGRTYEFRLVASTSAGEHGATQDGEAESFAAAQEPALRGVSVGGISSTSVDFAAGINPTGSDTSYRFQYVEASRFEPGASEPYAAGASAPVSGADVGSGDSFVSVTAPAGELAAATTYDYRLLASNGVGVSVSEDGMFTTLPASVGGVLPDGRAYELVTPPNKEDGEDLFGGTPSNVSQERGEASTNYDRGYSSEDGDHFLLDSEAAFGSFPSSGEGSYVFSRGRAGWTFTPAASPALGVQTGAAEVFDPFDFSLVGFHANVGKSGSEAIDDLVGPPGDPSGDPYRTVAVGSEVSGMATENRLLVGASADLGVVVVEATGHAGLGLCEGQEKLAEKLDAKSEALYEWSAAKDCLSLVDVKSESAGGGLLGKCGAALGQGTYGSFVGGEHGAVSADGSKIFFTAPDPLGNGAECWEGGTAHTPQLYMREGGETAAVSAPERGVTLGGGNPEEPAVFVGASSDGSRVFFVTKTELTREAVALKLHDVELYEYDSDPGEGEAALTRVSRPQAGVSEHEGGGVENVAAVSSDGGVVYFEARGRLTETAPEGQGPYLYRYDTLTSATSYIAPSGGYPSLHEPKTTWYGSDVLASGEDVAGLWSEAPYYTTADGEFLIFPSTQDIAGYDSGGKQELYRYDAEAAEKHEPAVVCVSCNPNGSPPSFGASFTRSAVNGDDPSAIPPRAISENGEYVFFDTAGIVAGAGHERQGRRV